MSFNDVSNEVSFDNTEELIHRFQSKYTQSQIMFCSKSGKE